MPSATPAPAVRRSARNRISHRRRQNGRVDNCRCRTRPSGGLSPRRPAVNDVQANQHADDEPPRLARRRGVFIGDVILAIGTPHHIFWNRPAAMRARNRRIVVVEIVVPFFNINGAARHIGTQYFHVSGQQPAETGRKGQNYAQQDAPCKRILTMRPACFLEFAPPTCVRARLPSPCPRGN